jgi:uncharacterized membrane-anchored protein YjiN (DUF445 family)
LLHVVDNYRDPLSEIVSETIESWDAAATSRRIELNIGTDLQFIRVNGTLSAASSGSRSTSADSRFPEASRS